MVEADLAFPLIDLAAADSGGDGLASLARLDFLVCSNADRVQVWFSFGCPQ